VPRIGASGQPAPFWKHLSPWVPILAGLVLIAVISAWEVGVDDLVAGDEGYYGIMARNARASPAQLVSPSLSPMGPPGDKPFLYPLLLAASLEIGGVDETPMRLLTIFFAVLIGPLLFLVARALGMGEEGLYAGVIYLFSPLVVYSGRRVAAEVPLTAFGLAGLWLFLEALNRKSLTRALLAGGAWGLAFLCKLWLIVPIMSAAIAGSLPSLWPTERGPERRRFGWQACLAAGLAFLAIGSSQLVLVALFVPEDLSHWKDIYWGFSLTNRLQGENFADYWHHPFSYYFLIAARTAGMWLPLMLAGLVALATEATRAGGQSRTARVIFFWLVPLVLISMFSVKSGNYLKPFFPALFLSAGIGFSWMIQLARDRLGARRSAVFAVALAGMAVIVSQISIRLPAGRIAVQSPFTLLLQLAWVVAIACVALGKLASARGRGSRWLLVSCLAASLLAGVGRDIQLVRTHDHVTHYQLLSRALAPSLASVPPQQACFFAPEWPSLAFYSYRSGRYWESPYVPADPDSVRRSLRSDEPWFFVTDVPVAGMYGGLPDSLSRSTIGAEGMRLRALRSHESSDSGAPPEPKFLIVFMNQAMADRGERKLH